MPTITFASSKGGAGRTTSAIVLATTLARNHYVTLIDADPTKRLLSWAGQGTLPGRLIVQGTKSEHFILDEIDEAAKSSEFVIIDLGKAVTWLITTKSDLVIIPMGDEQQDAKAAIETLEQMQREDQMMQKKTPVRILFCRTQENSKKERLAKSINGRIRASCSCFTTELRELPAFSWLHYVGGTLYGLDPEKVEELPKAIAGAELLAEEVVKALPRVSS